MEKMGSWHFFKNREYCHHLHTIMRTFILCRKMRGKYSLQDVDTFKVCFLHWKNGLAVTIHYFSIKFRKCWSAPFPVYPTFINIYKNECFFVHPIGMKTFISCCKNVRDGFGNFKNCTSWSTRCCPTRADTIDPIAMQLSQVVVKMLAVVFGILKNLEIVQAGVSGVALQEHTPLIRLRWSFHKFL